MKAIYIPGRYPPLSVNISCLVNMEPQSTLIQPEDPDWITIVTSSHVWGRRRIN
jgi:hypothetical protein